MKKFLIAGSSLAAVAAAGSAGAVDVTLGGSIEMGIEYGLGKDTDGFAFDGSKAYQSVSLNISAAGTTDAGMKFGGKFAMSTADELKLDLYANGANKSLVKLVNSEASAGIRGAVYNVSGGQKISEGAIVSVKINSEWQAAKSKVTGYGVNVAPIAEDSAICKVAGRVAAASSVVVSRAAATGANVASTTGLGSATDYMAAGRLVNTAAAVGALNVSLTTNTSNGLGGIMVFANTAGAAAPAVGDPTAADLFDVGLLNAEDPAAPATAVADFSDDDGDVLIADAAVYAGPFMSVAMTSSTTKMVVGAVCVTNDIAASSTKAYLDLNSRVMQVGAASVFIEGGFGKLTLQQGDYSGKVGAIGSAGDQATLGSTGLVAILEGTSLMGMAGYGAVDVGSIKMGQRPNYMLGTSVDLMSLTVAVEMEDVYAASDNKYIDNWDMGTSYALGDLAIDAVLDSAGDWALKASGSVAGFTASSVIENVKKGNNKKAGLSVDTTLSTNFNGIAVSIGLDEEMDYSLSGSYAVGNSGLAITAS